jgi:hypothetical protein
MHLGGEEGSQAGHVEGCSQRQTSKAQASARRPLLDGPSSKDRFYLYSEQVNSLRYLLFETSSYFVLI